MNPASGDSASHDSASTGPAAALTATAGTPPATAAPATDKAATNRLMDLLIRLSLIGFLAVYCYQTFRPFIGLTLWSIILAVALYPVHAALSRKLNGRDGLAATLLVLFMVLGLLAPATELAISFGDSLADLVRQARGGRLKIPEPSAVISRWPLIGQPLHDLWVSAHHDLDSMLSEHAPKLLEVTRQLLGYAKSMGTALLEFLVATVISGFWMAHGAAGLASARAIANRMAGPHKGEGLVTLSTATIRAVAQGVIGIACLQALLLGVGFIAAGIPGAGILALLVLLLGILQVPVMLITLPAILYVFSSHDSATVPVIFAVYSFVAGSVDNVLKPLLLGRGVDAPMPIILAGALGGMVADGIIGLFLGAVILALGYQLFMAWVYGDARRGVSE